MVLIYIVDNLNEQELNCIQVDCYILRHMLFNKVWKQNAVLFASLFVHVE